VSNPSFMIDSSMIDGATKLFGVIGYPLTYSLSPVMHNAAFAALQENYVYLPLPIKSENLGAAMQGFEAIGLLGFNITIPHKQAILPYLHRISDLAQRVGAVNTVYRQDDQWFGTNTDVVGFLAALQGRASTWENQTAVVLGNGGAARAVVAGCLQSGFGHICVVGRNPDKLADFLQSWQAVPERDRLTVHPWDHLPSLLPEAALVVNTTPIGMDDSQDQSPLTETDWELVPEGAIAYDLIYVPCPTRFLQEAMARGLETIDGAAMLVHQGAAAQELWLQRKAPVEVMEKALLERLAQS